MAKASNFLTHLRNLLTRLLQIDTPIRSSDINGLYSALRSIDENEWRKGEQNDSSDVLSACLHTLVMISDRSTMASHNSHHQGIEQQIRRRGLFCELHHTYISDRVSTTCCNSQYCRGCIKSHLKDSSKCPGCQNTSLSIENIVDITEISEEEIREAHTGLPGLAQDANQQLLAELSHGNDSDLFNLFCFQSVQETQCQEPGCGIVYRRYDFSLEVLSLAFQDPESGNNSLTGMFENWTHEVVEDSVVRCASGCSSHAV